MKVSKTILSLALIGLFSVAAFAQTAEEIVDRHVQAIGGKDKLLSIDTVIANGTFSMPAMNFTMDFKRITKRPNKMRMDLSGDMGNMITATNGQAAWMVNPFQGMTEPTQLEGDQAKATLQQADIDGFFVNREGKGIEMEYAGEVEEGGQTLNHVIVRYEGQPDINAFFEKESGVLVKMKTTVEQAGMEMESVTVLTDYQETNGIFSARRIEQSAMGQEIVITIDDIKYNEPVDDAIFEIDNAK